MLSEILITVVATVIAAILGWTATRLYVKVRTKRNGQKIYDWLKLNTRDEPGESHMTTRAIMEGTKLPKERVIRACIQDSRILWSSQNAEEWSIWRKEPQSVYEKRGILYI